MLKDFLKIEINSYVYSYNISLSVILAFLIYQVSFEQSYNINLIYLSLILSHIFGLFFIMSGSIKFFQWLKSNKEKLLIMYFISFISFSFLIAFSLIYNILDISDAPPTVSPVDFREKLAKSPNFPYVSVSISLPISFLFVLYGCLLLSYFMII